MKTVVLSNDLTFSDIIGNDLYERYVKFLEEDITKYFSDPGTLVHVSCPGNKNAEGIDAFQKMGLTYQKSNTCGSYYVNPRPKAKLLDQFYATSKACQFWREETFRLSDDQLYYLCGSRVNWIMELVDEYLSEGALTLLDYETKYPRLIDDLNRTNIFQTIGVFNQKLYEHLGLLPRNVVQNISDGNFMGKVDVLTAFETIERMFDPAIFFTDAAKYCRKGGLLLFTTASCTGFEYQVLKKHAPNLNPINRMNLVSIEALTMHVEKVGFEILELSTPGRLDVDIVRRVIEQSSNLDIDPFWCYILKERTEKTWQGLQNFLQENRLSSHVRIAARKL